MVWCLSISTIKPLVVEGLYTLNIFKLSSNCLPSCKSCLPCSSVVCPKYLVFHIPFNPLPSSWIKLSVILVSMNWSVKVRFQLVKTLVEVGNTFLILLSMKISLGNGAGSLNADFPSSKEIQGIKKFKGWLGPKLLIEVQPISKPPTNVSTNDPNIPNVSVSFHLMVSL